MNNISAVSKNWIPKIIDTDPNFKFLVVDNWYSEDEEKKIWSELNYLSNQYNIERAENTIIAKRNNEPLGRAFRFYLTEILSEKGFFKSPIIHTMYKQRSEEFKKLIYPILPYSRSFLSSNQDTTFISYYENNDYYDAHHDSFLWTNLIWFFKEPKQFEGGDLEFPESKIKVKLKHNRAVFFPCCYLHLVTPIKSNFTFNENLGRYCITHFYYSSPISK